MKFDFGDLYKFVVSAGLALAGATVLALWLLLKEPFDLSIKASDIKDLSPIAQKTIEHRQQLVAQLVAAAPWVSPFLVVLGFAISTWGLIGWKRLQGISDQLADLDLESKRLAIRPKTEDEAAADDGPEDVLDVGVSRPPPPRERQLLEIVVPQLRKAVPARYEIQTEMMVADVGVDVLLRGGSRLDKDYLIEIKLIRKGFNADWLLQAALKLRMAALVYQQTTGRIPNTCLLVTVAEQAWNKRDYHALVLQVQGNLMHRAGKHRLVVLPSSEVTHLSAERLRADMGLPIP